MVKHNEKGNVRPCFLNRKLGLQLKAPRGSNTTWGFFITLEFFGVCCKIRELMDLSNLEKILATEPKYRPEKPRAIFFDLESIQEVYCSIF